MNFTNSKYATLGNYTLCKTLGRGRFAKYLIIHHAYLLFYFFRVKLGFKSSTKEYYAIKIIKYEKVSFNSEIENAEKEIDILSRIHHQNIANMVESYKNIDYVKKNGKTYPVIAIILQFIPGFQLYQYLAATGPFSEKISRAFFKKIIESKKSFGFNTVLRFIALEYLHENGITHRNIKPENILVGPNFELKIIDFGLSTDVVWENNSSLLETLNHTTSLGFQEFLLSTPCSGASIDIFSSSMVLFLMTIGSYPFNNGVPEDEYFCLLSKNKFEEFWKLHERCIATNEAENQNNSFLSEEFKSLVNSTLTLDPIHRLTILQIKAHDWYNGPTATLEEITDELGSRKKIVHLAVQTQEIIRKKLKGLFEA